MYVCMKNWIIRPKENTKKDDTSIIMSLRLAKELQEKFDQLAFKSNYSRNELMCMALKYALDNLEFITNDTNNELHE